ncbi:hypothetical protein FBU59_002838 [Linderina macrospora]|uniref:Uncharacterized protein n=1 Tax=Linderina macrospora TaxID=4868 RepID=A0ACC1JA24_9FUNG|nr:hypothetical protein FBU59_002838 [Linderina macrospora]
MATAKAASRASLASQPVPAHTVSSVFVQGATPEVTQAVEKQGLRLVDQASEADLVFDDVPQTDRASNHHPLNSVFSSSQNTVLAFQNVAGAQPWLRAGFHLRSQLTEFTGAALMDPHSWWVLTNDMAVPNVTTQRILTSNPTTVVRHADVGYSTALQCIPSVISQDEFHVCARLALLTPDNGLYLWTPQMRVQKFPMQMQEDKTEPYQVLTGDIEVPFSEFRQTMDARFGTELLPELEGKIDGIVTDIVRIMLGFDGSDGRNFGIFSFSFSFGKGADGVTPYLQSIKPVSVSNHLSADTELLPSIISVLAGNPDKQKWKQVQTAYASQTMS